MNNLLKKAIAAICSAVIITGMCVMGVNAETVGDFTVKRSYSYGGYTTKITAYNGPGGDITLPEKVEISGNEYPITAVGEAFKDNELITSVTIPEGYEEIETDAFSGCTNLTSVKIPGSVDMISSTAFFGCGKLTDVDFAADTASSLTINQGAFANCVSLTSIKLPARLSSARYNFLYGCTSLASVTVNDGAQKFVAADNVLYNIGGDEAVIVVYPFGRTETEYMIPAEINGKAVTSAAMHLFRNNAVLKKVTVPSSVTNLGGYMFNGMSAIEEIILEHETAPTIGTDICVDMKAGSKIIVKNEDVAKAFESKNSYTNYYTPGNTVITVASQTPEVKTVSASFSVSAEPEIKDNKAVYNVYLDSAENVNTVLLKMSFDSAQVGEGSVAVSNSDFAVGTSKWTKEEDGKLVLRAYVGITGNVSGFSSEEKTKLAEISVPLKSGAKGNITAEIKYAKAAGVTGENESAMNGTVTISDSSASIFVPSYDVNGDGTVDIIDITEAQRYYQAKSTEEAWDKAKAMDVNGDNKVDIQDYIDIFNNLSDF